MLINSIFIFKHTRISQKQLSQTEAKAKEIVITVTEAIAMIDTAHNVTDVINVETKNDSIKCGHLLKHHPNFNIPKQKCFVFIKEGELYYYPSQYIESIDIKDVIK